jgi:hypothetical protein
VRADHREFLYAQTGGELYGDMRLGPVGALEYCAYGGTLSPDLPNAAQPGVRTTDRAISVSLGGRLLWFTPLDGLLAGFSGQATRFDGSYAFEGPATGSLERQFLADIFLEKATRWPDGQAIGRCTERH